MSRFKYDNAVTADLWRELEQVTGGRLAIADIMDTWTRQMGYPVLQLTQLGPGRYRVEQERYLTDTTAAEDSEPSPYGYRWEVPITWITSDSDK